VCLLFVTIQKAYFPLFQHQRKDDKRLRQIQLPIPAGIWLLMAAALASSIKMSTLRSMAMQKALSCCCRSTLNAEQAGMSRQSRSGPAACFARVFGAKQYMIKAHGTVHDFQNHPQQVVQLVIAQQGG
jgi:hypothetical protein